MKLIITIVKQHVENKQIQYNETKEVVAENVHYFTVSDSAQELFLKYNDDMEEAIHLQNETENWLLLDIKCIEVPLKIEL